MSVRVDASGRRWVRAEVETQGSVEELWQAIGTNEGLSSWFVEADFALGEDGQPTKLTCSFGPDMDSVAKMTKWDPPRGFSVISDEFIRGGPEVATDWRIEKGVGETCLLSIEHSLHVDSDEFDRHIEGTEAGWPAFFRILQIYMAHYRGQPCALVELMGAAEDGSQAWSDLAAALGFSTSELGERFAAQGSGVTFAGVVDTEPDDTEVIMHIDQPTTGVAHMFVWPVDGKILLSVRLYLYGEDAAEIASREEPIWRSWMEERFPYPKE